MEILNSFSLVFLLIWSCAIALPINDGNDVPAKLVQYESYDTENGHKFSYDTDDGQSRDEELVIKNKGTDDEEIVISGSYSFKGTDGLIYKVTYTADKNGYNAVVEPPSLQPPAIILIPDTTPPPLGIPAHVLTSLIG